MGIVTATRTVYLVMNVLFVSHRLAVSFCVPERRASSYQALKPDWSFLWQSAERSKASCI